MWHYNQLFPDCSKWAVTSRTLSAIYLWTQGSGTDQLGTRHKRDMRTPVSTKDPTSSTMVRKPLKGEQKVRSGEVSINVNHSVRCTQNSTLRAGCPRCAPRNTRSGKSMQNGPTNNAGLNEVNHFLLSRTSWICYWGQKMNLMAETFTHKIFPISRVSVNTLWKHCFRGHGNKSWGLNKQAQ